MADTWTERDYSRRDFLKAAGLAAAALAVPGCGSEARRASGAGAVDKPNFVIVFCDDAGYADIG
ncbi:MAG: twin-arginine translocation signal domain-containing protein, partial [Phycisphaerales bacterium]